MQLTSFIAANKVLVLCGFVLVSLVFRLLLDVACTESRRPPCEWSSSGQELGGDIAGTVA